MFDIHPQLKQGNSLVQPSMPEGDDSESRLSSHHLSDPDGRRYAATAHPTTKTIDDSKGKSRASLHPRPEGWGFTDFSAKFGRFFVPLLFAGLFAAYAPVTQAEMQQQGYGNTTAVALMQAKQPQCRSYGDKVGNKALNAFANLTTGVLEIPKNIINTTNQSNIVYGAVGGLFKGLIHTGGRIGVGIADLVTIPLPTKPIAQPIYIWEDFDVDTTYGPVFRLDTCQEEPSAVQAPIPEPVLAPAVIAPKPEPIDNAKQYRQETNQKLDTIFKKEMMK